MITVVNNTKYDLDIGNNKLLSNGRVTLANRIFDTYYILSDAGSIVITSEYGNNIIRNYGNLITEKSEDGTISIKEKE